MTAPTTWRCAVCGGAQATAQWAVTGEGTENGVDARAFRPSSDRFGETSGHVVRCTACGHCSLAEPLSPEALAAAYGDAADPDAEDEWDGRVATADRALTWIESVVTPGRLADLGCWTGAFVEAAQRRGWDALGIEPSAWAVGQGKARGLDIRLGDLLASGLEPGTFRAVVLTDVLEHLPEPTRALAVARELLEPGGVLFVTVPDAGSAIARVMGRRWWSVLPMHVQYFTRDSMRRLLDGSGFGVVGVRSHPKVFTAGYYAARLGGYSAAAERAAGGLTRRLRLDDRLVAPNFHDRMQVLARSGNAS